MFNIIEQEMEGKKGLEQLETERALTFDIIMLFTSNLE